MELQPAEIRKDAEEAAASGKDEDANPFSITTDPYLNGLWYGCYLEAVENKTKDES